jgi:surface antigen
MPRRNCISNTSTRNIYARLGTLQPAGSAKLYHQMSVKLNRKSSRRRLIRWGLVSFNIVLVLTASLFVLQNPKGTDAARAAASLTQDSQEAPVAPLDQISSANIAVTVARVSSLPETSAVTNQADSDSTALATTSSTSSVVAKPQVVATNSKTKKDIIEYISQPGDTVASLAQKYSVTSESIRWSNPSIRTSTIKAGSKLVIPPGNGFVYIVQVGDTTDSLASKFSTNKESLINTNDAESGLKVGDRIWIPNGTKAVAIVRTASTSFGWGGGRAAYGYNGYDYGYCTWWVAHLRAQAGNPVPSNLGNASTWAIRAAAYGLPVGSTPRVGAAVVTSTRGAGHVAYVTGVGNGTITISEMNHIGWNKVDTRTIPTQSNFRYIY